jgi:DNA invertase Pin-like site-specific DNA recombinase
MNQDSFPLPASLSLPGLRALAPSGIAIPGQRAAIYMRMSTEHQQYSIANQRDALARYAQEHGLEIVRTYADEARSGLTTRGRSGLCSLFGDVVGGSADYAVVLVYDVSRWGRFQDTDESACYEFLCRRAGIRLEYCMEPFTNDGTALAALMKGLKRIMAGEYSRELSDKVFRAKCRISRMGYRGRGGRGVRAAAHAH